jgi:hypothetical protein
LTAIVHCYGKEGTKSSGTQSGSAYFYSNPGKPRNLTIVDNKNNTFCISATKGSDGSNNPSSGVEIQYKLGSS